MAWCKLGSSCVCCEPACTENCAPGPAAAAAYNGTEDRLQAPFSLPVDFECSSGGSCALQLGWGSFTRAQHGSFSWPHNCCCLVCPGAIVGRLIVAQLVWIRGHMHLETYLTSWFQPIVLA